MLTCYCNESRYGEKVASGAKSINTFMSMTLQDNFLENNLKL